MVVAADVERKVVDVAVVFAVAVPQTEIGSEKVLETYSVAFHS